MCFAPNAMSRSSLTMYAWSAAFMTARKLSLKVSKKREKRAGGKACSLFACIFEKKKV